MLFWRGFLAGICALSAGLLAVRFFSLLIPERMMGHYRYKVAEQHALSPVDRDGEVLLQQAAADAFKKMQKKAQADGVYLVPLSGFRDYSKQSDLFFHGASLKNESKAERSHVCAPPGFSEHHTGYTVDIGDGAFTDKPFDTKFKDTASYKWLRRNAGRYHFELSFPHNQKNKRVAYEPWHWRYVGDLHSLRTFFHASVLPQWMLPD